MSTFDPDRFEDKYEHYFAELQQAYRGAFERMTDEYDPGLIHAVDQRILSESEPVYDGAGQFHIDVPENPADRLPERDGEQVRTVLDDYRAELERQLREIFDLDA